jgi:hypothetical protein
VREKYHWPAAHQGLGRENALAAEHRCQGNAMLQSQAWAALEQQLMPQQLALAAAAASAFLMAPVTPH